jgi:hypothetical protein
MGRRPPEVEYLSRRYRREKISALSLPSGDLWRQIGTFHLNDLFEDLQPGDYMAKVRLWLYWRGQGNQLKPVLVEVPETKVRAVVP